MSNIHITFDGAIIKHKRGDQYFWAAEDSASRFLKSGEIGVLTDSEGNALELRIGKDTVPFGSLKAFKDAESLVTSLTYLSEVSKSGNELVFTDSQGDTHSFEVGTGGGDGGSSASTERKLSYKTTPVGLTMLPMLEKCTSVPVTFEAASFKIDADNEYIIEVVNALKYTVTLTQDSTSQVLTSKGTLSVGSCKAWDPEIRWNENDFPNLESEETRGYDPSHTIDLLPLLKSAKIESNKNFTVTIDVYDNAGNRIPEEEKIELTYIIREPRITACDYPWHKPISLTDLQDGIKFKFNLSGAVNTTPSISYTIVNNLGTVVREDNVDADSSISGSITLKASDFRVNPVTAGIYTLQATLRCTTDGDNFIESSPYPMSLIFTDRSTYHITSPLTPVSADEGVSIEVPFVVSLHSEVPEATVRCECIDSKGATFGPIQDKIVKHIVDTATNPEPYKFTVVDYPVNEDFKIKLTIRGENVVYAQWEQTAYVKASDLSSLITDVGGYAYEFNASTINSAKKSWSPSSLGSRDVPDAELFGFNWATDGQQFGSDNRTCMRFRGDAGAVLDVGAMNTSAETTLLFDIAVPVTGDPYTKLIRCYASENGTGFYITPTMMRVFINGTTLERRFSTSERIRIGFTISETTHPADNSKCRFIYIYINGVMSGVLPYETGGSGLSNIEIGATSDRSIVNDAVLDVYSIRQYDGYLAPQEHLDIYNAGLPAVADRHDTYNRNNLYASSDNIQYSELSKYLPVVTFIGALPPNKGYKRTAIVHIKYPDDWKKAEELFLTKGSGLDVQGTSSAGYRRKNFKFTTNEYHELLPNELPAKVYCVKVDFAEGTGTHNTQNANITEQFYRELADINLPVKNEAMLSQLVDVPVELEQGGTVVGTAIWTPSENAKSQNSRIRTTIAGVPVALYYYTPPMDELYGVDLPADDAKETSAQKNAATTYLKDLVKNRWSSIKDSDRIFYSKGNLNFDKGAENVFGFSSIVQDTIRIDDPSLKEVQVNKDFDSNELVDVHVKTHGVESWEFLKNNDQQDFLDLSCLENYNKEDDYSFYNSFEPRFHEDWERYEELSESRPTVEDQQEFDSLQKSIPTKFSELYRWIASTNPDKASKLGLSSTVTFPGIDYIDDDGATVPGQTATYSSDYPGYRYAKFKAELENYFNKPSLLLYYVYTFYALMVDQRAKNMFLTFWPDNPSLPYATDLEGNIIYKKDEDGNLTDEYDTSAIKGKWYPYFYDNDTSFGIDNKGNLVLDYYNEDFDNNTTDKFGKEVYAGVTSVLWKNLVKLFPNEIHDTYVHLRSKTLNKDSIYRNVIVNGANKYSEAVYNQDAVDKYIASYLEATAPGGNGDVSNTFHNIKGPEDTYLDYFLQYRTWYCDSKWPDPSIGSFAQTQCPMLYMAKDNREGSSAVTMKLTSSINCYGTSFFVENSRAMGSGEYCPAHKERLTVVKPEGTNGQNLRYYLGIPQTISKIVTNADSNIYAQQFTLTNLDALEELDLSGVEIEDLVVAKHPLLRSFKANDFVIPSGSDKTSLNLTGCESLAMFDASGDTSNWKSISFANTGMLEEVHFPKSATALNFSNQNKLTTLDIPDECWRQGISAVSITDSSVLINNKRVDLSQYVLEELYKLRSASGVVQSSLKVAVNVSGCKLDFATLTHLKQFLDNTKELASTLSIIGTCHVVSITDTDSELYTHIRTEYPNIFITYDYQTAKVTYGDTGYTAVYELRGGNTTDAQIVPVTYGGATPRKESTPEFSYTFLGWYPGTVAMNPLHPEDESPVDSMDTIPIYGSCTVWPVFREKVNEYTLEIVTDVMHEVLWPKGSEGTKRYPYGTIITKDFLYNEGCPYVTPDGSVDFSAVQNIEISGAQTQLQLQSKSAKSVFDSPIKITQNTSITVPYLAAKPISKVEYLPGDAFEMSIDTKDPPTGYDGTASLIGVNLSTDWWEYINKSTKYCARIPSIVQYYESPESSPLKLKVVNVSSNALDFILPMEDNFGITNAQLPQLSDEEYDGTHVSIHEITDGATCQTVKFKYNAHTGMSQSERNQCIPSTTKYLPISTFEHVAQRTGEFKVNLGKLTQCDNSTISTHNTSIYSLYLKATAKDQYGMTETVLGVVEGDTIAALESVCFPDTKKGTNIEFEFGVRLLPRDNATWIYPINIQLTLEACITVPPVVLEGIEFPATLTQINGLSSNVEAALKTNLTDVWFDSDKTVIIADSAFKGCANLKFVEPLVIASKAPIEVRGSAFAQSGLEKLVVQRPILIHGYTFGTCTKLKEVYISGELVHNSGTYESGVFQSCSSLQSVYINTNMISHNCFSNCSKLKTVQVPDISVLDIYPAAFRNCGELEDITNGSACPTFVLHDATHATGNPPVYRSDYFRSCKKLRSNVLQSAIEACHNDVPQYCFYECMMLEGVSLLSTCQSIETNAFGKCTGLKEIDLSNCVQLNSIGEEAFMGCGKVQKIKLPQTMALGEVMDINNRAFYDCFDINLSHQITIPAYVHKLGTDAFGSSSVPDENFEFEVTLDGWAIATYFTDDDDENILILNKALPEGTNKPFNWGYTPRGTLHDAPSHSVAEQRGLYIGTKSYYWGAKTVHYRDEDGMYQGYKDW